MLVVRRLYTYLICAISLLALAIGLTNLLEIGLAAAVDALAGANLLFETGDELRQDISLYLALLVVAAPIWALHWYLARRWMDAPQDGSERHSAIRAVYFAVVLGVAIFTTGSALFEATHSVLSRLLGVEIFLQGRTTVHGIALICVGLLIWTFHALVRHREQSSAVSAGVAAWPIRVYLYGSALVAGFMFLLGNAFVLQLGRDALIGQQVAPGDRFWWGSAVASAASLLIVGGAIWSTHWWYARRLVSVKSPRTKSEITSWIRQAYLYALVLAGSLALVIGAALGLTTALQAVFGVDPGAFADPLWARMMEPIIFAAPFVFAWWLHLRTIRDEQVSRNLITGESGSERLSGYLASLTGIAFGAVGLGYLLGLAFEVGLHAIRLLDERRAWSPDESSAFIAFAAAGIALWAWFWSGVQVRTAAEPVEERRATSRRAYLYLVLTGTTLALLASAAFALYQVLQLLLGVGTSEELMSDLGIVLGIVVVATVMTLYHLMILRDDMRFATAVAPESIGDESTEASIPASLPLILSGASESRLREVFSDLQRYVPANIELREAVAHAETGVSGTPVEDNTLDDMSEPGVDTSQPAESDEYGPRRRIFQ